MYRKKTVYLFAAIAWVLVFNMAHAISDAKFQPAFETFLLASAGDKSQAEAAASAFETLLKAEPANPVLMAYTGAAVAIKAGAGLFPWKKMELAGDGVALIDKSLTLLTAEHDREIQHGTPGSLETKFVAASTYLTVPPFLNRAARGHKLLGEVLASPLLAGSPLPFQGSVLMRAATQALLEKRQDDARHYLTEIIKRNAPQASAAQAKLKSLTP